MRTRVSTSIKSDLRSIFDYVAQDSFPSAVSLIRQLRAKFVVIGKNPENYQLRPELGQSARLVTVGKYVILFRIHRDEAGEFVRIERVLYGGRNLIDTLID